MNSTRQNLDDFCELAAGQEPVLALDIIPRQGTIEFELWRMGFDKDERSGIIDIAIEYHCSIYDTIRLGEAVQALRAEPLRDRVAEIIFPIRVYGETKRETKTT